MDQYVTRMDYVDLDRQAQEMRSNTPSIKQMRFREMVTTGLSVEAVFFVLLGFSPVATLSINGRAIFF